MARMKKAPQKKAPLTIRPEYPKQPYKVHIRKVPISSSEMRETIESLSRRLGPDHPKVVGLKKQQEAIEGAKSGTTRSQQGSAVPPAQEGNQDAAAVEPPKLSLRERELDLSHKGDVAAIKKKNAENARLSKLKLAEKQDLAKKANRPTMVVRVTQKKVVVEAETGRRVVLSKTKGTVTRNLKN